LIFFTLIVYLYILSLQTLYHFGLKVVVFHVRLTHICPTHPLDIEGCLHRDNWSMDGFVWYDQRLKVLWHRVEHRDVVVFHCGHVDLIVCYVFRITLEKRFNFYRYAKRYHSLGSQRNTVHTIYELSDCISLSGIPHWALTT